MFTFKRKVVLVAGLLVAGSGLTVGWWQRGSPTVTQSLLQKPTRAVQTTFSQQAPATPSPAPDPFADLTIPGLRHRTYTSQFGPQERFSDHPTYTTYLTSYTSDGLKVNALLTKPKQVTSKAPAIVFVHGYIPPRSYRTTQNYAAYVDYLARQGFVVLKIDLRGHGSSEGQASGAYYSGDYVVDVLNAYAALQGLPEVDPNRVGLWGHSMAGNVTFRSLAVKKNIPAVAIWAGAVYTYSDFFAYGIDDGSYQPPPTTSTVSNRRRQLMETHGSFQADHPFWKQVPATNYLDGVTGAVGLFHATNDAVVSIEYSRNLNQLLDNTAISHQLHEYPGGGHNLSGGTFNTVMADTVEFFRQNLGN